MAGGSTPHSRLQRLSEHTAAGAAPAIAAHTGSTALQPMLQPHPAAETPHDFHDTVLTAEDHRLMAERGYIVVKNAAAPADLSAVAADVWRHTGMDPACPGGWHRPGPTHRGGGTTGSGDGPGVMVPDGYGFAALFHTPAVWRVRQSPRIHGAFSELWGVLHASATQEAGTLLSSLCPHPIGNSKASEMGSAMAMTAARLVAQAPMRSGSRWIVPCSSPGQ